VKYDNTHEFIFLNLPKLYGIMKIEIKKKEVAIEFKFLMAEINKILTKIPNSMSKSLYRISCFSKYNPGLAFFDHLPRCVSFSGS
jgi:hypothetical protein